MITKRSKVWVLYLYNQIKNESVTVYIKMKKGGGNYLIVPDRKNSSLWMFPSNKQNKLRHTLNVSIA